MMRTILIVGLAAAASGLPDHQERQPHLSYGTSYRRPCDGDDHVMPVQWGAIGDGAAAASAAKAAGR